MNQRNVKATYEVPSGVLVLVTRGIEYNTRREIGTKSRVTFESFVREGYYCYQFERNGWYMVVAKHEVRVSGPK